MNGDPGTRKDSSKTAPHDAPDCPTVRKVGTMISRQRAVVDGRDGVGVDKGTLNQVVDKNEKQHCERECERELAKATPFMKARRLKV